MSNIYDILGKLKNLMSGDTAPTKTTNEKGHDMKEEVELEESVKIVDRDSDLDQEHFKIHVNGKTEHFVHHNYENSHATDSKEDIHYQVKKQLKHLSLAHQKAVTNAVHASYRMKEEVEQIDELSKSTIGSYIKKAKGSAIGAAQVTGMGSSMTGQKTQDKDGNKTEPMKQAAKDAKKKEVDEGREFKSKDEFDSSAKPGDYYNTTKGRVTKTDKGVKHERHASQEKDDLDEGFEDRLEKAREKASEKGLTKEKTKGGEANVRLVKGRQYGGSKQKDAEEKDDLDESKLDEISKATLGSYVKKAAQSAAFGRAKSVDPIFSKSGQEKGKAQEKKRITGISKAVDKLSKEEPAVKEVAPPGAKAERMVKHIKKGYANDGKLTKREKGIAYATAWKAHNKGQVEEGIDARHTIIVSRNGRDNVISGTIPELIEYFKYTLETGKSYEHERGNAKINLNPKNIEALVKNLNNAKSNAAANGYSNTRYSVGESRQVDTDNQIEEGTEFGDKIKNSQAKLTKVKPVKLKESADLRKHPIYTTQEAWDHYAKELAEQEAMGDMHQSSIPSPTNTMPVTSELDEIAQLAGLTPKPTAMNEGPGVMLNGKEINVNSIEVDGVNSWDRPDFTDAYITYAEYVDGTPLGELELDQLTDEHGELVNQAAHDSLLGQADFIDEEAMGEGNEFSGALAAAKAAGEKEFEVDGKTYTVKEETSVNDIRRLSGLAEAEDELAEERDIEYVNTPREKTAPLSAAIPSGTDLHKSKMQDSETANKAANPLTRKEKKVEEALWKSYESMINDVKK